MLNIKQPAATPSRQKYAVRMDRFGKINMSDAEAVMSLEESPEARNIATDDGRLKRIDGFGWVKWIKDGTEIKLRQLPRTVENLFEFQATSAQDADYRNFYFSDSTGDLFKFRYAEESNKIESSLVNPDDGNEGKPYTYFTQFKCGTDNCALLGGPECGPYIYTEDGTYRLISSTNKPHMSRTAMHYGRMFGVGDPSYPQRVWFSKLNDPDDFSISDSTGGYIDITDLIGDTIDVFSVFDTLYIFCRYGIAALNSLSLQCDFSVENVYYSDSEIINGSISLCGGQILFATRYGVYAFNGSSVSQISRSVKGFFKDIVCRKETSVCFNGSYFLSYHKKDGECGMIVYNLSSGNFKIFTGADIISFAIYRGAENEKLITAFDSSSVVSEWGAGDKVSGAGAISALWRSPKTCLGAPNAEKTILEAHFTAYGDGDIVFTVNADGHTSSHIITLENEEKAYHIPIGVSGHIVNFQISNRYGSNFSVSPLMFIYTIQNTGVN